MLWLSHGEQGALVQLCVWCVCVLEVGGEGRSLIFDCLPSSGGHSSDCVQLRRGGAPAHKWITSACCMLQVFFKMDKNGEGEEVQLEDLPQCKDLAFQGFGHDLFQEVGWGRCMRWPTPDATDLMALLQCCRYRRCVCLLAAIL